MHDPLVIGVIEGEVASPLGLAQAVRRHPGLSVRSVAVDEPVSDGVTGLIVDVPLAERSAAIQRLAPRWRVPILVESPVAGDLEAARAVGSAAREDGIVAANPLRYALHTRRLLEEVAAAQDPLQTFYAAWRFRGLSSIEYGLPQLLDYLQALSLDEPCRISAMQHADSSVLIVTFRYAADVLGSIEIGSHLPASFPSGSELVVECFCAATAYVCVPGNQAVQLYGRGHGGFDWQPDPADAIVGAFAAWLRGGPRPVGDIASDLATLRLVERINRALQTGVVLEIGAIQQGSVR